MTFAIPTLKDLLQKSRQSFRANLKGSDASIWPNNVYVSAKVIAGMVFELFGFADYIQRQKFAVTADGENLDLHGDEFGIPRKPAGPAKGDIVISAVGALSVAAGAIFQRLDLVQYRALNGGSIADTGDLTIAAIAVSDGKNSNAAEGAALTIISGVTGTGTAEVGSGGIVGGVEVEGDEEYRARILFRKRNPPHGGSAADYVLWASNVSGVTRVFVEPLWADVGTVRVFVLMDDLFPANGIPGSPDIDRVADYIETVRPAGASVTVSAPIARPIDITVKGLTPDNSAVREAVMAELADAFHRLSRVAGGAPSRPNMPFLASATSFSASWIWQAVANASGEQRHKITAPIADIALTAGYIATLGEVTFESE